MRDYQKELADSLDKSDQIAKLEAKVDELQRQLAEAQEVGRNLSSTWKSTEDELQRQLEVERQLFDRLNRHCGEVERLLAELDEEIKA